MRVPHSTLFWLTLLQGLHSDALAAYSSALDSLEKAAGNAAAAAAAAAAADCSRYGFALLSHARIFRLGDEDEVAVR